MAKTSNPAQTSKLAVFSTLFAALQSYKASFWLITKVTLVVAVPVGLLQLVQTDAFNGDSTVLSSVAWGYAILAILYVLLTNKPTKKLSQIYTTVSGRFLQYVIITLVMILAGLPTIGALLIWLVLLPSYGLSIFLAIPSGLALVGVSAYLLAKYVLALPIVATEKTSSWAALGLASKLSAKNKLRIIAMFLILLVIVIGLMTGIAALLSLVPALNENKYFNVVLSIIESTVFIPVLLSAAAQAYQRLS